MLEFYRVRHKQTAHIYRCCVLTCCVYTYVYSMLGALKLHCIFATNSISQLPSAANTATAATDLRFYAIIASVNTAAYHFRGHIFLCYKSTAKGHLRIRWEAEGLLKIYHDLTTTHKHVDLDRNMYLYINS